MTEGGSGRGLDELLRDLAQAPAARLPPAALLHYRVLEKLGEGGMGAVYKAEDTKLGRLVAIKRVRMGARDEEVARRRLLREARAASALNHPAVVTIFAIEQVDDVDFIVMEYVPGEPLDAVIARGPLDPARVLAIGADVADALDCAHAAGLVHRDVKPANVVVTPNGRVKVLDFGIAKQTAREPEVAAGASTQTGGLVGTVPYMSPEQLGGGELDGRSDLWALGCVLYEAATGRRAFAAGDLASLVRDITLVDPRPPSEVLPSVPPELDAIVLRALAKDPARRFASGAEMAAALRAAASGAVERDAAWSDRAEAETVLVGRAREIEVLSGMLGRAADGRGGLALVTGEAGTGKSALVEAFLRRTGGGVVLLRGRAVEQFGAGEAYLPLFDAFSDLLAGPDAAAGREILHAAAPTWSVQMPSLQSTGTLGALRRDAMGASKERMLRELGDALAELALRKPVVLVLEDVHWADPSTFAALQHLIHRVARQRVLVVTTVRPAELEAGAHPLRGAIAEWRAKRLATELPLRELPEAEVARWLELRFAPCDFPPSLAHAVWVRTEGHPLFVAGMLDVLVEQRIVSKDEAGRWRAGAVDAASLGVPENLRGLMRAKIDAVGAEERDALESAAVQGEEFLSAVLADLLALDETEVDERLARVAKAPRLVRMIGQAELPDGALTTRWRFAHALYRDVLYEDLPARRRVLMHRQVGSAMAARYGADAGRLAAVLAVHFEQGRDFARATAELVRAGENAMRVFAGIEAERHYTRALACAERASSGQDAGTLVAIHEQRALALTAMGRHAAAIDDLAKALELARAAGDAELEGGAHVALADAMIAAHRLDEAAPHVRAALDVSERAVPALRPDALAMFALERLVVGDLDACGGALARIADPGPLVLHLHGLLHYFSSRYADAEQAFARSAELNEAALADGLLLMESRMFRALAAANQGRLGEARRALEATLELARRNDSAAMRARVGNSLGWVHRELGDVERAAAYDARAIEEGRASEESEAEANALVNASEDEMAQGRTAGVAERFARVAELADSDAWLRWRYGLRLDAARARSLLAGGALADAAAAARALRERAREQRAAKYVAVAYELEARAELARGEAGAAARAIEAARAALEPAPAPLVAYRVERLAAGVADRLGDAEGARLARERAAQLTEGIARDLEGEERARFLRHASA